MVVKKIARLFFYKQILFIFVVTKSSLTKPKPREYISGYSQNDNIY
mgnify:CR=1 FL=1